MNLVNAPAKYRRVPLCAIALNHRTGVSLI